MSDHMQPNGRCHHYESLNSTRTHAKRINVVAIRKSSRPPKLNTLTKRMRRLLHGRFGNETSRKLIVSVWESKSLQFRSSSVLLNSTSSRQGCIVCYMAGSATRRGRGFQELRESKQRLISVDTLITYYKVGKVTRIRGIMNATR